MSYMQKIILMIAITAWSTATGVKEAQATKLAPSPIETGQEGKWVACTGVTLFYVESRCAYSSAKDGACTLLYVKDCEIWNNISNLECVTDGIDPQVTEFLKKHNVPQQDMLTYPQKSSENAAKVSIRGILRECRAYGAPFNDPTCHISSCAIEFNP